jgi:hypothetical protein
MPHLTVRSLLGLFRPERSGRPQGIATAVRAPAPFEGARLIPPGAPAADEIAKGGGFRHSSTLNDLVSPRPVEELRVMRRLEADLRHELESVTRERERLEKVLEAIGVRQPAADATAPVRSLRQA